MANELPSGFLDRLDTLGWFRFDDPAQVPAIKRDVIKYGHVLAAGSKRYLHADAEDLAEGGIVDFLAFTAPILRAEGIEVAVVHRPLKKPPLDPEVDWARPVESLRVRASSGGPMTEVTQTFAESYVVRIGDRELVAWETGEAEDGWITATAATIDALNWILSSNGSRERAWAHMGGNDLHVVFATEELAALLNTVQPGRDRLHDGTTDV